MKYAINMRNSNLFVIRKTKTDVFVYSSRNENKLNDFIGTPIFSGDNQNISFVIGCSNDVNKAIEMAENLTNGQSVHLLV